MAAMTRRQYLGGSAALGAGLLAAACDVVGSAGGEVAPDATQETRPAIAKPPGVPNQTKQTVAVQVHLAPIGSYGGNTPGNRLTTPFTETHPHITVEWHHWNIEPVAETSATGVLQDVLHFPWVEGRLGQAYVARLVTQGMLLGLNQFIRRDQYDLTDYWPGCLHASTWRDDLYALHTEVDTNLVFYNQELFAAAGVPVPTGELDLGRAAPICTRADPTARGLWVRTLHRLLLHDSVDLEQRWRGHQRGSDPEPRGPTPVPGSIAMARRAPTHPRRVAAQRVPPRQGPLRGWAAGDAVHPAWRLPEPAALSALSGAFFRLRLGRAARSGPGRAAGELALAGGGLPSGGGDHGAG